MVPNLLVRTWFCCRSWWEARQWEARQFGLLDTHTSLPKFTPVVNHGHSSTVAGSAGASSAATGGPGSGRRKAFTSSLCSSRAAILNAAGASPVNFHMSAGNGGWCATWIWSCVSKHVGWRPPRLVALLSCYRICSLTSTPCVFARLRVPSIFSHECRLWQGQKKGQYQPDGTGIHHWPWWQAEVCVWGQAVVATCSVTQVHAHVHNLVTRFSCEHARKP
jgi:hypothetical protein